jgi:hypothetical protein
MGPRRAPRVAAAALSAAMLVALAPGAHGETTNKRRARVAVRYIISNQQSDGSICAFSCVGFTADAVVAMAGAQRGRTAIKGALDYLEDQARQGGVTSVGERAKVLLAAVAGGRDPRDFGGHDLVTEIRRSERDGGRYGPGTPVFDHATAMLGLVGAGFQPSRQAIVWLKQAQCPDHGWQYDNPRREGENRHCFTGDFDSDFFSSDTNTTSLAVEALEASGAKPRDNPFKFFRLARDEDKGGWGYSIGYATDANSTAMVIQGYAAKDVELPDRAMPSLKSLQLRLCGSDAGAFEYSYRDGSHDPDLGATVGAVLGLLKEPLPVRHPSAIKRAPDPGPCK